MTRTELLKLVTEAGPARGRAPEGASMQVHITRSGIGGVYGHPVTRCDAGGCGAGTEMYYADLVPSQWKEGDLADVPEPPTPCVKVTRNEIQLGDGSRVLMPGDDDGWGAP